MTKNRVQKVVSYLIFLLAAVMIVVGILGVSGRSGATGQANLTSMQTRAVLNAAGEGAVEAYVALAKSEATKAAKEAGGGMAEISVPRKSACGHDCEECAGCGVSGASVRAAARNPIGAEVGQKVVVESSTT